MLYELIAVVRPGNLSEVKEIARTAGQHILRSNGVVRGITNWGDFLLPRPTTKHQTRYNTGHYFIMRFDSSATIQQELQRTLGLDPRMIRYSVIKMGERLGGKGGGLEKYEGKVQWMGKQAQDSFAGKQVIPGT